MPWALRERDEDGIHVQEFERFVELLGFGNGRAIVASPVMIMWEF